MAEDRRMSRREACKLSARYRKYDDVHLLIVLGPLFEDGDDDENEHDMKSREYVTEFLKGRTNPVAPCVSSAHAGNPGRLRPSRLS